MKSFFRELFEYNHYHNQKLISLFSNNAYKYPNKILMLCSHILNAHLIWNNRILQSTQKTEVWEMLLTQDMKKVDEDNYTNSLHIIENFDLTKAVNYKNSKGALFENIIRDILFHVINHSTYHRGQIALAFRQNSLEPIASDYIFFKR